MKDFCEKALQAYVAMWKNYVNFNDRTSLSGYWLTVLCNFAVAIVLGVLTGILPFLAFLSVLYSLATLIPGLAITVRRLRDTGKRWYALFIALVPLVGEIILIIWLCGNTNSNEGAQV